MKNIFYTIEIFLIGILMRLLLGKKRTEEVLDELLESIKEQKRQKPKR